MSKFEIWLNNYKNIGAEIKTLAGSGDTALYTIITKYSSKYNFFSNTPKYHVWVHGKCIAILDSYISAHALFKEEII